MLATSCNVEGLLKKISANGATLSNEGAASKQQFLAAARSFCYALDTPLEAILGLNDAEVSSPTSVLRSSADYRH